MRNWPPIAGVMVALGALSGVAAYEATTPRENWQEVAWPFQAVPTRRLARRACLPLRSNRLW